MLKSLTHFSIFFALFSNSVEAMTDQDLSKQMRAEINQSISKVKSPKLFFHWVDASDVTPRGQYNSQFKATEPMFKTYVDKQGKKVYNRRNPNDRDIAGPGLYMAGDPKVSRSYGGEKSFGLIVGAIDPKANILLMAEGVKPSDVVVKALEARGCYSIYNYTDLIDTYEASCLKPKQLLIGKDISFADARFYSWSRSLMPGCSRSNPTRDRTNPAVGARDQDFIDTLVVYSSRLFSDVYGYTHKSSVSGDKLADSILSYLKGMQVLGLAQNMVSAEQLKDASIKPMTLAEIKAFSQKYILGCVP